MARKTEDVAVDFVKCELESAISWACLAQTERRIGEMQAAEKARGLAQEAYDTFLHFRSYVENRLTEDDRLDLTKLEDAVLEVMRACGAG